MADFLKGKDSLMKRLLSTAPNNSVMTSVSMPSYASSLVDYPSNVPSPASDSSEDSSTKLSNFLRQLARQSGRELNIVMMDHAYSKPSNWRSENTCAKPTKTLFVHHVPQPHLPGAKEEQNVDIESVPDTPIPPYDVDAVRISMSEYETYINSVKPGDRDDDWEEHVNRTGWSNLQQRIFGKMARALHLDRLARLACAGSWNEPVQRRIIVDRTARRVRHLLSCHNWEAKITQWLHATLLDSLSSTYLAIYLDVLQTMRAKAPVLVDRMIASSSAVNRPGLSNLESLNVILKQPWDPVASSLNEHKPRKLPGNPILLMVPSTPMCGTQCPRQRQWESYFSALGMVATVMVKSDPETSKMSLTSCLDQMMCTTRVKVAHLRAEYPGRHIILVGWNAGASVACQVALVEPVSAVVCLGFPVLTVEGKRGEPNDTLLDVRSPVFFVIGENGATAQQEDLEDIRERMRAETGLVVVGSADDLLRMSNAKKMAEGVTQNMVDRCILDEVGDFLGSILMIPRPMPMRTIPNQISNMSGLLNSDLPNNGIIKVEKRKNPGSEPSSPAPKRSRPGTPLHGTMTMPSVVTTASSTSTSKSTLTTLPTLVSVTGTKGARQKPRMTAAQKLQAANAGSADVKWAGQMPTSQQVGSNPDQEIHVRGSGKQLNPQTRRFTLKGNKVSASPTGITVNIGSLGSLTPIGPIRLSQSSTSTASPNQPMSDGTSLTIQGNLISSGTDKMPTSLGRGGSSGATSKTTLQLQAKQLMSGRGMGKPPDGGTLTSLSSLLQGGPATRIMVSSASSLLSTPVSAGQQLKVLGSDDNLQGLSLPPASSAGTRMRTTSGRMLDLSKLTVLAPAAGGTGKNLLGTSAGNVVMLAESPRASRPISGGPLLVPVSSVASPFTLVPLANKTSRVSTDRSPTQRSYTVIPKITVPSLKLNHSTGQQMNMTGPKLSYSMSPTLLRGTIPISTVPQQSSSEINAMEANHLAGMKDDEDVLSAAKILELPIIFAKDGDDSLFVDNKMGPESLEPPTVVPISSGDGSSTVTLGDTISFPLEPDMDSEKGPEVVKSNSSSRASRAVPNVFIIRSKNAKEKSQQTSGNKRIIQKTHRFIRTIDKIPPSPSQSSVKTGSGIKYTKIILTNRNSSLKVGDLESGSGVSIKHDQLQSIDPDEGTVLSPGTNEDMNIEDIDDPSML